MTTKYRDWYCQVIESARNRVIPTCYTEVHHIKPRALGGGDEDANLVRLTYREHFLVHWLLTKFCSGKDRRAMQFAMNAMTMPISGNRIIAGWQFDAVKRALKDLQDDPEIHEAFMVRYYRAKQEREGAIIALSIQARIERERHQELLDMQSASAERLSKAEIEDLTSRFLRYGKRKTRLTQPKLYQVARPKRSDGPTRKKKRGAALDELKRLGLKLNGG